MLYGFIEKHEGGYPVAVMCEVLEIGTSGYYAWRKRPASERVQANEALKERIAQEWERSRKTYGSPRMTAQLNAEGERCSENRVARLMVESGLNARKKRGFQPQKTDSAHGLPMAANLLDRDFAASAPNQKWVGDVTFIATQEGWLYLAVWMDLFSRKIIGWAMSDLCDAELVLAALRMAQANRQAEPGVLVHSDRGSIYASTDHRQLLETYGFLQSMSRKGNCWDNAVMESFFSSLKIEDVYTKEVYLTRAIAQTDLFDYIEVFYNRQRLHSSLGFKSPVQFEFNHGLS